MPLLFQVSSMVGEYTLSSNTDIVFCARPGNVRLYSFCSSSLIHWVRLRISACVATERGFDSRSLRALVALSLMVWSRCRTSARVMMVAAVGQGMQLT